MKRLVISVLYWLAVLVISVVLLVILVLFFESRDASEIDGAMVLFGIGGLGVERESR